MDLPHNLVAGFRILRDKGEHCRVARLDIGCPDDRDDAVAFRLAFVYVATEGADADTIDTPSGTSSCTDAVVTLPSVGTRALYISVVSAFDSVGVILTCASAIAHTNRAAMVNSAGRIDSPLGKSKQMRIMPT